MLVNMADKLQNTLPNSLAVLQFLPHGLALTVMYVVLALNWQDYNILSHLCIFTSFELNSFSFAKKISGISTSQLIKGASSPAIFESCAEL